MFWLRGCLCLVRYVNKVERELYNYLSWELTIENLILANFEKLSEIFACVHLIDLNSPLVGRRSKGGVVEMALHWVVGVGWPLALSGGWVGVQSPTRCCMHLVNLTFPLSLTVHGAVCEPTEPGVNLNHTRGSGLRCGKQQFLPNLHLNQRFGDLTGKKFWLLLPYLAQIRSQTSGALGSHLNLSWTSGFRFSRRLDWNQRCRFRFRHKVPKPALNWTTDSLPYWEG